MKLNIIKRALISVADKTKLDLLLPILKKFHIEIISSGKTYKIIKNKNFDCVEVANYTGFPEMLSGRLKTLHPKIHAGILNIRSNKKHKKDLKNLNIPNIDLVIANFYPFEKILEKNNKFEKLIENIDIGGPTLIRAAAKNFKDVVVISDPYDYQNLVKEMKLHDGSTSIEFRKKMSAKAFGYSAYYDSVIANYFNKKNNIQFPKRKTIHGNLIDKLRYGENPHQKSSLYSTNGNSLFNQIHGKKLSYNNYNDIYSGINILKSLKKKQSTVIIKHANPCGVSIEKNALESYKNALRCDPISAFGGVLAINSTISKKLANEINKNFFEVIISNGFSIDALKIFKKRKNIRLINIKKFKIKMEESYNFLGNVFLTQEIDNLEINENKFKFPTKIKPTKNQIQSLKLAFKICKFVKSNAIVLVNNKSTIGIGAGQPSRLDSCKIASDKALNFVPEKIAGAVAASDAFFPFPDGIEELISKGIKAIIQPGGSINDKEVIKSANDAGITMILSGTRHFKH